MVGLLQTWIISFFNIIKLFYCILRQNAIRLEENEKREKQLLSQIIDEADMYKLEFYKKRQITCESNKSTNRDREKVNFQ